MTLDELKAEAKKTRISPCKEYIENFFTSLPNLWRKINIGMA